MVCQLGCFIEVEIGVLMQRLGPPPFAGDDAQTRLDGKVLPDRLMDQLFNQRAGLYKFRVVFNETLKAVTFFHQATHELSDVLITYAARLAFKKWAIQAWIIKW